MRFLCILMLAAASLFASDATGKWTGTVTVAPPATDGSFPVILILKQDGNKLTGTGGPDAGEQYPLSDGKVENGKITFEVPAGGAVMKFSLTLDGDEIKGDVTRQSGDEKQTAKLAVKREK